MVVRICVGAAIAAALALQPAYASQASVQPRAASCHDLVIPVTAKASNRVIFAPGTDLTTPAGVSSFLGSGVGALGQLTGFIPVSGSYNISARYCEPASAPPGAPASRAKTLQVLVHGIPYDKNYWSGLNFPGSGSRYSWIDAATAQGYPVLAIDNLGSGNSSRPSPTLVVQQSLETEILQQIITSARQGRLPNIPQAQRIVYVGHSIGSVIGNGLATKYPKASFDAAILTGYTTSVVQGALGLLLDQIEPAGVQNPERFGNLDPAYLTFASVDGKRSTYFSADGEFDAGLPAWDVNNAQGTVSLGELVSVLSGLQKAPEFTGDVLVVTGDQDALFCSIGSRKLATPNCGSGETSLPAKSHAYWPNARRFDYFIPKGGHAITLHYSAAQTFARAHDFLAQAGY